MLPVLLQVQCAVGPSHLVTPHDSSDVLNPKKDEPTDAEWVARALNGEQAALTGLFRRHAPRLLRRATRLLARTGEAEDVVQDAFVEAFRDLEKLQQPERFARWLMRIVTHQSQRRFRRRNLLRRLGFVGVDDAGLEQLVDPSAGPEAHVQCAQLDEGLRRLSAHQRAVWVLRYVEACTLPEIAEANGCSLATVKRHLSAASGAIREYVDFELPEEPIPLPDPVTLVPQRGHSTR